MFSIEEITTTGNEIATLHEAQTYFRSEQSGGIEDALIMSLVRSARESIERHIDRSLVDHTITVFASDWKGYLPLGPIDKDSIQVEGGNISAIIGNKYLYVNTLQDVTITYNTEAYINEALKNAVLELAFYWYERGEFNGGDIPMKVKAVIKRFSRLNFIA